MLLIYGHLAFQALLLDLRDLFLRNRSNGPHELLQFVLGNQRVRFAFRHAPMLARSALHRLARLVRRTQSSAPSGLSFGKYIITAYLSPFPVVFAVRAGAVTADAGTVSP